MIAVRIAAVIAALVIGAAKCGTSSGYHGDRYDRYPMPAIPKPELPTLDLEKLRRDLERLPNAQELNKVLDKLQRDREKLGLPRLDSPRIDPRLEPPAPRTPSHGSDRR
jgi:hypothetical protein